MIELQENETIRLVVRRHWFIFAAKMFPVCLALVFPPLIFLLLRGAFSAFDASLPSFDGGVGVFLYLVWIFILWLWSFVVWTDFYLDVWILTDKRLFDIEQKGLFRRNIAVSRIDNVQDVTTIVSGVIPTFFNYGEIHVQTAGSEREFVMRGAPAPEAVKQVLTTMQELNSTVTHENNH